MRHANLCRESGHELQNLSWGDELNESGDNPLVAEREYGVAAHGGTRIEPPVFCANQKP